MAQGFITPLQLTAAAGLLNNQGINSLPASLTSAITSFNNTAVVTDFLAALTSYQTQSYATPSTLSSLQSIGNSTCPALGDSIPSAYTNLTPVVDPGGFTGLITQTGNAYLGNGNTMTFCQNFLAAQGYQTTTNDFINSAVNAQTYLGPTFSNMDSLTTNNISSINPDFAAFGTDLFKQGNLTNLEDLALYGTPAALLRQLSNKANINNGTISVVETPLIAAGLTEATIKLLINRPSTVTDNEFNQLQLLAYTGMTRITGADLQQVLSILNVTTPDINTMADLLNQQKIFPNSWSTLKTPTPSGWVPVYQDNGSVNMSLQNTVGAYLPSASGCEELGKIIPPDQAVANKSTQASLQQISGIAGTTLPQLAQTIIGIATNTWNINQSYLENSLVSTGTPIPANYRAQQDVPAGINITDTAYWLPTSLGGLSTMAGLSDIQSQTSAISSSVATQFSNLATGSGPNGTVTVCDIIGLAIDYNNFAVQLNSATSAIDTLDGLGELNTLKAAYVSMLTAPDDAAVITLIATANSAISSIVLAQPALTSTLNSAFDTMAALLSQEKTYQTNSGVNFFDTAQGTTNSVYAFVQNLPTYGVQVDAGGPAYFLNQVADTSIITGQAIVGSMREGANNQRLGASGIDINIAPSPAPAITPRPVVTPVY